MLKNLSLTSLFVIHSSLTCCILIPRILLTGLWMNTFSLLMLSTFKAHILQPHRGSGWSGWLGRKGILFLCQRICCPIHFLTFPLLGWLFYSHLDIHVILEVKADPCSSLFEYSCEIYEASLTNCDSTRFRGSIVLLAFSLRSPLIHSR